MSHFRIHRQDPIFTYSRVLSTVIPILLSMDTLQLYSGTFPPELRYNSHDTARNRYLPDSHTPLLVGGAPAFAIHCSRVFHLSPECTVTLIRRRHLTCKAARGSHRALLSPYSRPYLGAHGSFFRPGDGYGSSIQVRIPRAVVYDLATMPRIVDSRL